MRILFCRRSFKMRYLTRYVRFPAEAAHLSAKSTQGWLRCTQHSPHAIAPATNRNTGFPPYRKRLCRNRQTRPQLRASAERGSCDPCRWKLPPNLNSQHPPRTGRPKLRHQKLHRCAILRIFRPAFRTAELTRILHRY